jgi:hypothetical protein
MTLHWDPADGLFHAPVLPPQLRPYQTDAIAKIEDAIARGVGPVDGVVGIEGGVVSGVINLESSGVGASDWRPRHGKHYQEV